MRGKPITHGAIAQFLIQEGSFTSDVYIEQITVWLESGVTVTTKKGTKLKANKKRTLFHTYKETNE